MKKYIRGIAGAALFILLTGCSREVVLNEKQTNQAAEYIGGVLLKYSNNYDDSLVYEETEPTQTPSPTKEPEVSNTKAPNKEEETDKKQNSGKPEKVYCKMNEIFTDSDFKISYKSFSVLDSYKGEEHTEASYISAGKNKKLLVVHFNIKNLGKKKKTIDLVKNKISYRLELEDGTVYTPTIALIMNDLQFLNVKIAGGKSERAVLIFKVAEDIESAKSKLIISKNDKETKIDLK